MASIFHTKAKVQIAIVLLPVFFPVAVAGLFGASMHAHPYTLHFWIGLLAMLFGYALLVHTKWDQVYKGDFFTWGLSTSAQKMKPFYIASYLLIFGGFLMAGLSGLLAGAPLY